MLGVPPPTRRQQQGAPACSCLQVLPAGAAWGTGAVNRALAESRGSAGGLAGQEAGREEAQDGAVLERGWGAPGAGRGWLQVPGPWCYIRGSRLVNRRAMPW